MPRPVGSLSPALAEALDKLNSAAGYTAAKLFTPAHRRELNQFARQTRVLSPVNHGSGASYQLIDSVLVSAHLAQLRPPTTAELDASLPQRANNIARMRHSKGRRQTHDTSYLLLKALEPGVASHRGDGVIFDLSANTTLTGAAVRAE